MRDILRLMHADLVTARASMGVLQLLILIGGILGLFLVMPLIGTMILMSAAMMLMLPPGQTELRYDMDQFYGILPASRKNIARARFWYAYSVFLVTECCSLLLIALGLALRLCRFLPWQDSPVVQELVNMYTDRPEMNYRMTCYFFLFMFALMLYLEFMARMFGRENESKFGLGLLAFAITAVVLLSFLFTHDVIPPIDIDKAMAADRTPLLIGLHIGALALTVLLSEIAAAKYQKREL